MLRDYAEARATSGSALINSRLRRFQEKQYQRNAQRRNEATIKVEHYREIARYFERECGKATHFNAWNAQEKKQSEYLQIRQRAESLRTRREKLRELLNNEERNYTRECEQLQRCRSPRLSEISVSSFRERLQENRTEASLYRPRTCRRLQSYLSGACVVARQDSRAILKDFNRRKSGKNVRMSGEKTHYEDQGDSWDRKSEASEDAASNFGPDNPETIEQDGYNKRMAEYKENSRSARASNLYGGEPEVQRYATSSQSAYRPAAGLATGEADHRGHSRKLHDSHFLLGNQLHLQEQGSDHKEPNQKFNERYANRSLEATNVGETAAHSMDESDSAQRVADEEAEADVNSEETKEMLNKMSLNDREYENNEDREERNEENDETGSMKDNASSDSRQGRNSVEAVADEKERRSEQHDIDAEVNAKASAGRSDHRHFESEKSLPWLRMIPGDKNLSEQMFLYLTHIELKGQIQDLEKRENQAASKHQWDEALRLRDMRNRLDLARERNLYRREDLLLDPEVKKIGMAGIEARSKLLKERETLCTNSSMYSEEAKIMWSQWLVEDQKSVFEDARLVREDLMKQLEENWRSLAVEDKQKISDSFTKDYIDVALQNDHDNTSAFRSASR